MLFPSTGAVTPTPPVSGNTTSQTLCSGSTYTVKVAITNTTNSQQLGSADVTFPANVTLSSAACPPGRRRSGRSRGAATSSHCGSSRFRRTAWSRLPPPSAPAAPQRPHRRSPLASSSRTTSATPARTRTRTGSKTRRSRRFGFRPAPRPSPAACTTTATRAARSRSTPRRRRATSQSRGGRSHCSARRVRPPMPMSTPTRRTRTACTRSKARSAATSGCASLHPTRLTARAGGGLAPCRGSRSSPDVPRSPPRATRRRGSPC